MRKFLLAGIGIIVAGLTATTALAQTTTTAPPYPPPAPTTTIGGPTSALLDLGEKPVPSTFDITFCQFLAGTITQSEVDGQQGDDQRAASNGCVTKSVELSFVTGTALSSVRHPLAVTGFAQANRLVRIRVNGRLYQTRPLGFRHSITVTGTGANLAPRSVTATFTTKPAGSTTRSRSGLARTGDTVAQWSPLGLGLVGIGYLLVTLSRRRRTT